MQVYILFTVLQLISVSPALFLSECLSSCSFNRLQLRTRRVHVYEFNMMDTSAVVCSGHDIELILLCYTIHINGCIAVLHQMNVKLSIFSTFAEQKCIQYVLKMVSVFKLDLKKINLKPVICKFVVRIISCIRFSGLTYVD